MLLDYFVFELYIMVVFFFILYFEWYVYVIMFLKKKLFFKILVLEIVGGGL